MMKVSLLLHGAALVASSTSSAGRGFGQAPKTPAAAAASPSQSTSPLAFLKWAEDEGIKTLVPLSVSDFEGERGIRASEEVEAGAAVLSVPVKLALQVNSFSKPPKWCEPDSWAACKWDARLAMLLLNEDANAKSELRPWLEQLPRAVTTPALSPALLAGVERLDYPAVPTAVAKQRAEWDAARARAPGRPSAEEWDWAMSIVRSRSFTGPYTSGTFIGALAQLFLASTAAVGYALIVGGAGAADQAFDAFLFVVVFVLSNELIFGPRLTTAKRYVLCPWIDFLNHDGALGGSEVAYEYFTDSFSARLDFDAGPVAAGEQVMISYGARSNDVLLQYYGFVQPDNPHEVYALEPEALILEMDAAVGLPDGALAGLKSQPALAEALLQGTMSLKADGADERAMRLARLLTNPALAAANEMGAEPLRDGAAEAAALRALAGVANARLAALPAPSTKEDGTEVGSLLSAFVAEKQRVLAASAAALEQQATSV